VTKNEQFSEKNENGPLERISIEMKMSNGESEIRWRKKDFRLARTEKEWKGMER